MTRLLLALLLLLPIVARAADPSPGPVVPGSLTWGTSPTFAPFEFQQDGHPAGFDVDMVGELARRVGLQPAMLGMDFAGLVPALQAHRIDLAVSGLYITPAREAVVDFIAYLRIGNQIVAPAGNPAHLAGREDLCGHPVAVVVNTAFEKSLQAVVAACTAAGHPAIDILSLPNSAVVALSLTQGRVVAAFSSTATVAAMIDGAPGTFVAVGPAFDTTTRLGIGIARDQAALRERLAAALADMNRDGTYKALMARWHLPADSSIF